MLCQVYISSKFFKTKTSVHNSLIRLFVYMYGQMVQHIASRFVCMLTWPDTLSFINCMIDNN